MTTAPLAPLIDRLLAGGTLGADEVEATFGAIMAGTLPEAAVAGFLVALRARGETGPEIAAAARVMRRHAVPVPVARPGAAIDTCGTGGDASGTINVSTAAALVAAAAGVPVAKHGNRSVSSRCGSADVLEACGVRLDLPPGALGTLVDETGIAFLFAPRLHPAMAAVMPVRRALGVRTVFNLLGPLTNPAGVRRQVVGVWSASLVPLVAEALAALGAAHALVVHGLEGLDELSACGPSEAAEVRDGRVVRRFRVRPEDAGIEPGRFEELVGGDVRENARRLEAILGGRETGTAADAVALNAGAALVVAGRAENLRDGTALAREILASGAALETLRAMARRSAELAGDG